MRKLSRVAVTGVAALALSVAAAPAAGAAATSAPPEQSAELRDGITSAGLMEHLQAFQAIADANDDTRAAGTPGYDKSVEYVVERLRAAGYTPSLQSFPFPYYEQTGPSSFERLTPTTTTFVEGTDFDTIQYSGNGTATGAVQAVDVNFADPSVITSGCEATDFAGFTRGNIALIQRGTCEFAVKIQNAEQAGATGVIIFNQGNTPERSGLLTGVTAGFPHDVPVITTSFALGQELAAAGTTVRFTTQTISEIRQVANVVADTPQGDDARVTVVGAHLDSVVEGPGINDNGTGSSAILEIAEQIAAEDIRTRDTIRFAWWGAEEAGLVGSEFYVANLSDAERANIAANLNFDMLGSTNFARMVYDGDESHSEVPDGATPTGRAPVGSAAIERIFLDYFASQNLATYPTEFSGRSDYRPFIAQDIPAGGLFSGAEEVKNQEQFDLFGGILGEPLDPCYHEACDTIANVNMTILDQMADAAAHATLALATGGLDSSSTTSRSGDRAGEGQVAKLARSFQRWRAIRR